MLVRFESLSDLRSIALQASPGAYIIALLIINWAQKL